MLDAIKGVQYLGKVLGIVVHFKFITVETAQFPHVDSWTIKYIPEGRKKTHRKVLCGQSITSRDTEIQQNIQLAQLQSNKPKKNLDSRALNKDNALYCLKTKRERKRERGREAGKKAGKEGGEGGRKEGKQEKKEAEREKEEKKRERLVN